MKTALAGTMGLAGGPILSAARHALGARADGRRLNVVFFLIDDLGWRDVSCYGSKYYETPDIDRLAAEGMRFTQAYAASPVCSPTRASILTGKNPARLHLTNFLVGRRWPEDCRLRPVAWQHWLPLEEVTIAEALREAGYACGYVGKWHLGGEPYTPEAQGFAFNRGGCHLGSPPSYFDPYKNPALPDRRAGEYLNDRLADEAEAFLEANRDRPFFLYFAHYAVHIPLQARADLLAKYEAKAAAAPLAEAHRFGREGDHPVRLVQDHPVYAAMVESVDQTVGRMREALARLGLADRTAVFFFSDNGGLSTAEGSPTSNAPLRAGKGWLYEGGIREPLVVKWPGVARPGSVSDVPVISDDFYPTILEMAGLPARPAQHADGRSLAALLRGGPAPARDALFFHYPHFSNQGGRPGGAVRAGRWKLLESFEDGRLELYDLHQDVGETEDLAAAMPDRARRLQARLAAWRAEVGAQVPARAEPPGGPA
jgi:arylsulfatase A-like enzyme